MSDLNPGLDERKANLTSVIDRVRKLLALGNSPELHESLAATAKANELIDRYRLDISVIENVDPIEKDSEYVYETGRIGRISSFIN